MYAEIVTLAVMIGCIPCIIHSLSKRGQWPTVAFFVGGFVFGIINFALGGFLIHWGSIFFDYIFAFTVLGVAGIFRNTALINNRSFIKGIALAGFLRYLMHSISGVLFFSQFAGTEGAFIYSFIIYNLPYMTISVVLCIVVGLSIKDRIANYL